MNTLNSPMVDTVPSSTPVMVRWSAVFAGSVVAIGLLLLLYALGLGTGFATLGADARDNLSGVGLFSGVWGAVVPLVALFVGGYVASLGAGATRARVGVMQGLLVWALSSLALVWVVVSLIGGLVGGVVGITGEVARAGGGALAKVADGLGGVGELGQSLGKQIGGTVGSLGGDLDLAPESLLKPFNEQLRAHGRAPVSVAQLREVSKAVAMKALRAGRLDREDLTAAIGKHTSLAEGDAVALADKMEAEFNEAKQKLQAEGEQARDQIEQAREQMQKRAEEFSAQAKEHLAAGASRASEALARFFWGLFAALTLALVAAVGGGRLAVSSGPSR